MNIERKSGEPLMDYHKRLVYGKLVDRTLADVDYTELSEYVYGQAYSSDVARRMMYGSRRTLELMDAENINSRNSDIRSEIDDKIAELQRERQKFFDQRREYNKLLNRDGRIEHLYDALADAANNLSNSVGAMAFSNHSDIGMDYLCNEAVLVFSDWHYGMTAKNVFNEYSTEICKKRVANTVNLAKERIILHKCRSLHIVVLGDLIHGSIHIGTRVASEELACDQLMQVSEILAQAINELSTCVESTTIYMTYGNHARTIQNKNESIHRDNMERIVPWWLEQRLKDNSSVTICSPSDSEFLLLRICGHDILASHGDLDSVKSSPRLLTTLFHKKYGVDIEYVILGDKHHIESFNELGVTAAICGSLCGTDEHANTKRLYSEPSQMLLIVNEQCGVDAEYRLKC